MGFEDDLAAPDFTSLIIDYANSTLGIGGELYILANSQPFGLMIVQPFEDLSHQVSFEWLLWASRRQKLEAIAQSAMLLSDQVSLVIKAVEHTEIAKYHERLCDFGILRPVGSIDPCGKSTKGVIIFQAAVAEEDDYSHWPM